MAVLALVNKLLCFSDMQQELDEKHINHAYSCMYKQDLGKICGCYPHSDSMEIVKADLFPTGNIFMAALGFRYNIQVNTIEIP